MISLMRPAPRLKFRLRFQLPFARNRRKKRSPAPSTSVTHIVSPISTARGPKDRITGEYSAATAVLLNESELVRNSKITTWLVRRTSGRPSARLLSSCRAWYVVCMAESCERTELIGLDFFVPLGPFAGLWWPSSFTIGLYRPIVSSECATGRTRAFMTRPEVLDF